MKRVWGVASFAVVVALLVVALFAPVWHQPVGPHVVVVEMPAAGGIDWSPWRAELDACRERTDHLRGVLERLIPSWPGRAALPDPPGGWPAWPVPGVAREWRADGW